MNCAAYILKVAPEAALFLAIGLGHALGRVKLVHFSLGGVAGSLVVALVIGQFTGLVVPDLLKAVCFALFIYSVGFKSGPEFFGGFNSSSIKLVLSSIIQCVAALLTVVLLARTCGFGKGFASGLGAGALTQTAMLGTAQSALTQSNLAAEQVSVASGQMAVAFAITYVFGTVGVIIFVRSVAPRLLGMDPRKAARELEATLSKSGAAGRPGLVSPFVPVVARAFKVSKSAGQSIGELAERLGRASVERIVRNDEIMEPRPELVLKAGDIVGVVGRLESVLSAGALIGDEVGSEAALSFYLKASTVVLASRRILNRTLGELRAWLAEAKLDGVYLSSFRRQGLPLPVLPGTTVRRGDVAELIGRPEEVDRAACLLGTVELTSGKSDLAYHAVAIVLGALLGSLSVVVYGVPVTLGVGGGVLLSGLAFGWLHARNPAHGALPGAAQWILSEFGLSAFAAAVGLAAGPQAVAAIQQQGWVLFLAGAAVTLVPLFVALAFGKFVLRLHPVIQLGALCGGQTVAAALSAVNEVTESNTPVLGFTMTYAVSNVLLAVWGPVVVALT